MAENSTKAAKKRRGPGRPFQPGKSGNPGGRPAVVGHIKDLARKQADQAILTLAEICADIEAPHSARVAAAQALLDRGYGKPTQYIEDKANPIDDLNDDDQRALLAALTALAASEGDAEEGAGATHH